MKLYPSHAILDPGLCATMPEELTISTGLDALSHAMEAIWNRRHTEMTDTLSEAAIRMVTSALPGVIAQPDDIKYRRRMQTASVIAGLAMGTTQTAVAHSISYPFTARFDMPHGLACSFTLAEVIRFNGETSPERLQPIAQAMDCAVGELADCLEAWFDDLGLGRLISRYVEPSVTDSFGQNLITRARAANNIREIDGEDARSLARRALDRMCTSTTTPVAAKRGSAE
jgi:alcohol dehydrogenase